MKTKYSSFFKKSITLCICAVTFVLVTSLTSAAAMRIEGDYNLPIGGLNRFEGEDLETREDAIVKEAELRKKGYVLVSSAAKEISEDQYVKLRDGGFWFSSYMREDQKMKWALGKTYLYKPLVDKYCRSDTEDVTDSIETRIEIEQSAVVFAYEYWYTKDRSGKISDEFNDNMPDWYEKAYLEINSNIDCEIVLIHYEWQTYYKFYISKGTPFMVRLPMAQFNVVSINGVDISRIETNLNNNNLILLTQENIDRDHAFVLDISKVVNKYKIPSGDIGGKPDYSIDQNQHIPEERTVVKEEDIKKAQERVDKEVEKQENQRLKEENMTPAEKVQKEKKKFYLLVSGIVTGLLLIIKLIFDLIRKKVRKDNDEEEGE